MRLDWENFGVLDQWLHAYGRSLLMTHGCIWRFAVLTTRDRQANDTLVHPNKADD